MLILSIYTHGAINKLAMFVNKIKLTGNTVLSCHNNPTCRNVEILDVIRVGYVNIPFYTVLESILLK